MKKYSQKPAEVYYKHGFTQRKKADYMLVRKSSSIADFKDANTPSYPTRKALPISAKFEEVNL